VSSRAARREHRLQNGATIVGGGKQWRR